MTKLDRRPRLFAALAPVVVAVLAPACSTDTTPTVVLVNTSVGVDPVDFMGTVPCGPATGSAQSYVATLLHREVDAMGNPVGTPVGTSVPVSCQLPVSFENVVVGQYYSATIQVFDVPASAVDASTMPKWSTTCADGGIGAAQVFTDQRLFVGNCVPLTGTGIGTTSITIDASALAAPIGCSSAKGPIDKLTVTPTSSNLPGKTIACGQSAVVEDASIQPGMLYTFRVDAFGPGATDPGWATTCTAIARAGVAVAASCEALTANGYIRIDAAKAVTDDKLVCGGTDAESITTYDVTFDPAPSTIDAKNVSCSTSALLGPFAAGSHSGELFFRGTGGAQKGHAICFAKVSPGQTTTATCEPD